MSGGEGLLLIIMLVVVILCSKSLISTWLGDRRGAKEIMKYNKSHGFKYHHNITDEMAPFRCKICGKGYWSADTAECCCAEEKQRRADAQGSYGGPRNYPSDFMP